MRPGMRSLLRDHDAVVGDEPHVGRPPAVLEVDLDRVDDALADALERAGLRLALWELVHLGDEPAFLVLLDADGEFPAHGGASRRRRIST